MKRKLIFVTVIFSAVICIITGGLYFRSTRTNSQDISAEYIITLNEIEHLAQSGDMEAMSEKIADFQQNLHNTCVTSDNNISLMLLCIICIVFIFIIFGYVYFKILRPFEKMKDFAEKIAQGNFDIPLNYERSDYFGDFTWAFDSMRNEITKARTCEKEAVDNNKIVIATLSHDIKTPIASIRAYTEGLEANLDGTAEKRAKYLNVITRKCDEVSKLTDDLFLHSLSDLDKLKISPEKVEICTFIEKVITEISGEYNNISFTRPNFTAYVSVDKNRLTQIAENLINNAQKYAKSNIDISVTEDNDFVYIHFRDYGEGIPDEDMPFIFGKFYRGRNCGDEQGSGLGLYIVKYIAEKMSGNVLLHNHSDGLEAEVSFIKIPE